MISSAHSTTTTCKPRESWHDPCPAPARISHGHGHPRTDPPSFLSCLAASATIGETGGMRSRWPILALLCVLASLLAGGTASANSSTGAENRVWDFQLQAPTCVGGAAALTPGLHQGSALAEYDFAYGSLLAAKGGGTEIVERAMSRAELDATRATGLVRGGRDGTHFVSDAVNNNANRARQRLALPQTPEVKVQLEVPKGSFGPPSRVGPANGMPGGGMERTGAGQIPAIVHGVRDQ